jgi:hypothetical protein
MIELTKEVPMSSPTATKSFTIKEPTAPASQAQANYLTSLCDQAPDYELTPIIRYALTAQLANKGQASKWINVMIPVAAAAKQAAKTAKLSAPIAVVTPEPHPFATAATNVPSAFTTATVQPAAVEPAKLGYYEVPSATGGEPTIYYFAEKKTKYGTKKVLMKLFLKTDYYTGKQKGSWRGIGSSYTANKALAGQTPMTKEDAGNLGKKFGFCIRCCAFLTDPVSVANGLGPICITYWQ